MLIHVEQPGDQMSHSKERLTIHGNIELTQILLSINTNTLCLYKMLIHSL